MTQQVTRKQTEITSSTVNRVVKDGKTLGYLVKSDSSEQYYQVRYINHKLHCSCPATCECKHIRAIKEVGEARQEMKAEQVATPAPATPEIQWVTMPNGHKRLASQANDPCLNSLDRMAEDYGKLQEEWKQQQASYDIIGEALQVVNAEIVSQEIGDAYEQVGDPRLTREQYVNMFGIYE